jgi:hypothetical protein
VRGLLLVVATLVALAVPALAAAQPAPVTWCGSDEALRNRVPDIDVTSRDQVRFVYAVPADAPDNFLATASGIAIDAAWIEQWWQGQDPTRTPRFDRYPFPGCSSAAGQLDIGFVRLGNAAAYYEVQNTPSTLLDRDLASAFDASAKTIVYYDAPIQNTRVCGETDYLANDTGGDTGIVYVYLQSGCTLGAAGAGGTAEVAAHELLHNLGAVPADAPHECPDSESHACDSEQDIMYPFIGDDSTLDSVFLDVGHDDYYAHGSAWWDVQDSNWLTHLPQWPVSLAVAGNGALVTRTRTTLLPCGTGCTDLPVDNGAQLTVTAVPLPGFVLSSWSGACAGASPRCAIAVKGPTTLSATFVPRPPLRLAVAVSGRGAVTSAPAGLRCSASCTHTFAATTVRLTAKAAAGWRFAGWRGACTGARACLVTVSGAARATFVRR